MTLKEVYDIAEIWYQRSHKLREVWQNEKQNPLRFYKAFRLHMEMIKRVLVISKKIREIESRRHEKIHFGSTGGFPIYPISK